MPLTIGKLARSAGLTVRALRHYHAIGLLCPSARSKAGFRLYDQADVRRLHHIQALKHLGFSLADIQAFLAGGETPAGEIMARQITALDGRIQRATALKEHLARLLARLESGRQASLTDWLELLERMHMYERHFSRDELAALRGHLDAAGPKLRDAWRELLARIQAAMDRNDPAEGEAARELARDWARLALAATGNDRALAAKCRTLYEQEAHVREAAGISTAMLDWISRAVAALRAANQKEQGRRAKEEPKSTALAVATLRAAHQVLDAPLVFADPFALALVGPAREAAIRNDPDRFNAPRLKGLRASLAARSRLAEEAFGEAKAAGVAQAVILGAGLDTFALRHPEPDVRVFEVDHPATQAAKRWRLAEAGLAAPANLTFVPLDFEDSTLAASLGQAGFRLAAPAFFSWLGVTMYLEESAVLDTLRFIGMCAPTSAVVFDYGVSPDLLPPGERQAAQALAERAAGRGEPWKTFFDPVKLGKTLWTLGFSAAQDLDAAAINARYLADRTDGLRKNGVSRLVWARV